MKLANHLDGIKEYDLANELDDICRQAAESFIDSRPESEKMMDAWRGRDTGSRVEKELKPRPGEDDPRRVMTDEEGTEEDRSESVPEERMKKLFPGKKVDISPEELSLEDLPEKYLEERVEDIEDFRDPERDVLVELMEKPDKPEMERPYKPEWED